MRCVEVVGNDVLRALGLLRAQFGDNVRDVQPLAGGFFSRAFAATAGGREYVIRINADVHAAEGFAKDDYAWRRFASPGLPIPRIVKIGATPDARYAISERVAGRTLAAHSVAERRDLLPAVLDTLETVARSDTSASRGYGEWDSAGEGRSASWRDYLAAVMVNDPDGYYQDWHALFHDSFLERDVYEVVFRRMLQLAGRLPEERALIHNDFQFENIIADEQRVTGVIDWGNALYGDPLYDVARLAWWSAQPGWWHDDGTALLGARFGAAPRYAERVACYQCHIGLDDLRFYAKNGKREEYDFFRDRLLALVTATSGH